MISGFNTGLDAPLSLSKGIAIQSDGTIDVAVSIHEGGSALQFYTSGSNGNVSPVATIAGCTTGLFAPQLIALDSHDSIYVSNGPEVSLSCSGVFGGNNVLVFSAGGNGDVSPLATIAGNATDLNNPAGIAVH